MGPIGPIRHHSPHVIILNQNLFTSQHSQLLSQCSCRPKSRRKIQFISCDAATHACTQGQRHYTQDVQQSLPKTSSRRQALASAGIVTASFALMQPAAVQAEQQLVASGSSACQLNQSASGLLWCDIHLGDGQLPIKGAFTKVNYTAKLASTGAVFDSTYQRRQPLVFKVGECEMVKAFDVAILGAEDIPPMQEGGKRLVVAPPGPLQRQGVKSLTWVTGLLDAIEEAGEPRMPEGGFNSTLVFEVELVPKRRG